MIPCSFHGTRVIGVPPPSSIAWNMPTAAWYSDRAVLRVDAHVVEALAGRRLGGDRRRDRKPHAER